MKRRLGRSITRRVLRVATDNEATFTAAFGAFEAFLRLGIPPQMVTVEMVPFGEASACPAVIVTQGEKKVVWRLNKYVLQGTAEKQQKAWVDWVIALVGENSDVPQATRDAMYRASELAKPGVAEQLIEMLIENGIKPGTRA